MDIEKTLIEMVKINSAGPDNTGIISYMEDLFEGMGLDYNTYDSESPYILAKNGKGGVIFSGHLDTVPVGKKWSVKQGSTEDGRIYGRGTCDMKGGIVASLAAAERLREEIFHSQLH
ncbi:MAG: M20/M25/M40 family metallo-hydrolase [Euryarchaeota archaeon]|nr:M20/M25/M40 family metallo-hydrolase [Euryarchaeota archaeon]